MAQPVGSGLAGTRNQVLTAQLTGIETKRFNDDRWFDFDAQGHLMLVDRPLDCLSQIWEWITRLFTDKFTPLAQEFTQITDQVDYYLKEEDNVERLETFLQRFTPALNELYRCAGRMHQAQKISQQVMEQMHARKNIQDMVLVPRPDQVNILGPDGTNYGVAYATDRGQEYRASGKVALSSTLQNAKVNFRFNNPAGEPWLATHPWLKDEPGPFLPELRSWQLTNPRSVFSFDVAPAFQPGDVNEVTATVTYPLSLKPGALVNMNARGDISSISTTLVEENASRITFRNDSPYALTFTSANGTLVSAEPRVVLPREWQSSIGGTNYEIEVSYTLPSQRLACNFKDGNYACHVDQDGLHVYSHLSPALRQHREQEVKA